MAGEMIAFVIARSESDEAISLRTRGFLDCFASLAIAAEARFSESTERMFNALA
jgi:hypothetical protein